MKLSHLYASFLVSVLVAGVLATAAFGDESTTHLKFSDPTKPGTLLVNLSFGEVDIRGADVPDITVVSDARPSTAPKRSDGLRVLTSAASYSLAEKNNVATLEAGYGPHRNGQSSFHLTVPQNTAVTVRNQYGETRCSDLTGDIEVSSSNGEVTLKNVSAGASVETMNGAIHVGVKELKPNHALSFSSMNGEVVIHLPATSQANLQLRTQNGSILTDFDDKDLVSKVTGSSSGEDIAAAAREIGKAAREAARAFQEVARARMDGQPAPPMPPMPPLPSMTGGQTVSGILHGGGTTVQAATMNGDVTVRKE